MVGRSQPCKQGAGLASWLCAATFVLPPLPSIPVTSGSFKITLQIDHLACGGIRVGALTSDVTTGGAAPTLTLAAPTAKPSEGSPYPK